MFLLLFQALSAGQGQNPARQASLKAGLPIEVPAYGINMLCGSGLKSVIHTIQQSSLEVLTFSIFLTELLLWDTRRYVLEMHRS